MARVSGAKTEIPLQPRDVIRSVNNKMVITLRSLQDAVRALTPGSPVTLQIQREGKLTFVSFTYE